MAGISSSAVWCARWREQARLAQALACSIGGKHLGVGTNMSILNTSVSGMLANTNWLSTISQNVANSNTTAYKDIETDFSALVSGNQSSGPPGAGVATTTTALNQLQGQLQQTSTTTDLAIQGAGY